MDIVKIATSLVAIGFCVIVISYMIGQLKDNHGSYIEMVWLAFSLTFVIPFAALPLAAAKGAIDKEGGAHGFYGELIQKTIQVVFDLDGEGGLLLGLLFVIVVPQLLAYPLSALSGSASKMKLVREGLTFSTILMVKGFASASGLLLSMPINVKFYGWDKQNLISTYFSITMAAVTLMLAFTILYFYVETSVVLAEIKKLLPKRLRVRGKVIHTWAKRNRKSGDHESEFLGLLRGSQGAFVGTPAATCKQCGGLPCPKCNEPN